MTARPLLLVTCSAALALALASPATAETLREALQEAYAHNPTITGQRAQLRVADEEVPLARAAGLPTLEGSATFQENVIKGDPSGSGFFSDPDRQVNAQLSAEMPLINFGAVRNSVRAAQQRVDASRHGLRSAESELFTAVVGAYMDVLRDEAAVRLNEGNTEVMRFTLTETQDRERAGNRGPTDVAQAEARLALAEAQLETARAQLIGSREEYIRLVGHEPGVLEAPPPLPQMPGDPQAAVDTALENNPQYLAALSQRSAAGHDVEASDAKRMPQLSAIGALNQYDYLGSLEQNTGPRNGDRGTTGYVGVRLNLPIFQGGRLSAQVRQAQARQAVAIEAVLEAERAVVADTRAAFATYRSATRVVESAERGVEANRRVLAGLRAETSAGFRPLLDRLNAEQELLNAEVTLVTARRDAYVAGFALLAAMGHAEARDLDFEQGMLFNPVANFDRVNDRVLQFARDAEPVVVATGTRETAIQYADIFPLPEDEPQQLANAAQ